MAEYKYYQSPYQETFNRSAMAQVASETWNSYLLWYYSSIDEFHAFSLKCLDRFFKSYQPPAGGAKLLEFGGGAVVSNLISAAPKCKEIVFGEFREDNRERIHQWLRKDPLSFNWHQFFSYVVGTLEGGTEVNIEERKELLRNTFKAVVPFDIFQADPVKDKGPYDIITSALCLEYLDLTKKEYVECVAKVAHLLKPGGIFVIQALENVHSWVTAYETTNLTSISREFLQEALEVAGFSQIRMEFLPREYLDEQNLETVPGISSLMFVVATKVAD